MAEDYAAPDWRGLCEELLRHAEIAQSIAVGEGLWDGDEDEGLLDRARAALAQPEPEVVGPTMQLPEQAPDEHPPSNLDRREIAAWYHGHGCGWQAARAVLARWGRPAPVPAGERQAAPVPVASDVYFEFVVSDADYCTQAGGIAPTYAQALSEGQHYLAQYLQDGPHTLELRRVEVLPLPSGEVE